MISIFNGRSRSLGDGGKEDAYLQVSVRLRKHLYLFKGAKLGVFMAIALHVDKHGWSTPDIGLIHKETGYNSDTISTAITELCKITVNGHRVLLKDQTRKGRGRFGKKSVSDLSERGRSQGIRGGRRFHRIGKDRHGKNRHGRTGAGRTGHGESDTWDNQ